MHYHVFLLTIFAVTSTKCFAEVQMTLGVSQVVVFEFIEEEMQVRVHNPQGRQGEVSFCFEASPDTITAKCPQGYAQLYVALNHHQKEVTYKVHRQGYLKLNPQILIEGKIKFREDGSIKVMVAEVISAMSVSLPNAKVFIPEEKKPAETKRSFTSLYWVIFGLASVAALILIVAITWYCCCYKRQVRLPSSSTASTTKANQGEQVVLLSVKPKPSTPLSNHQ
uniref:Uncharacterized protein n=1 Tax=Panagrellus redivivus TaxID=6233 RepID=A0A7E4WD54_PANRE